MKDNQEKITKNLKIGMWFVVIGIIYIIPASILLFIVLVMLNIKWYIALFASLILYITVSNVSGMVIQWNNKRTEKLIREDSDKWWQGYKKRHP